VEPEQIAAVAGRHAQSIRKSAGVTLAEVAKAASAYGLAWTTGRVGAFESGRVSPTLPTLLAVSDILGGLTGTPITLADLFQGSGRVVVTDNVTFELSKVRAVLAGRAVQSTAPDRQQGRQELTDVLTAAAQTLSDELTGLKRWATNDDVRTASRLAADFADADFKIVKSIGLSRLVGALAMSQLWGQTFVAERDSRSGPEANPQRKGRVARELKAELQRWRDGDDQ
jgi:transcriptional regulator with XRE-family HTH domain